MSARPFHKRYHSDALTGYRVLNLEQRGAYTTILDLLYDSGEEALPGLDRWWSGQLGVSTRKWRALRDELEAFGKIDVLPDGRITNRRYLRERAKQQEVSGARAESGAKGGRARQQSLPLDNENERSSSRVQPEFAPYSTPENELKPNRNADEHAEKCNENNWGHEANASGLPLYARASHIPESRDQRIEPLDSRSTQPAESADVWSGDLMTITNQLAKLAGLGMMKEADRARNMDVVKAWRADGIDIAKTVVPIIERDSAENPDEARWSLLFYDRAVRRAIATGDRRAKPAKPTAPAVTLRTRDTDADRVRAIRARLNGKPEHAPDAIALKLTEAGARLVVVARSEFALSRVDRALFRDLWHEATGTHEVEFRAQ